MHFRVQPDTPLPFLKKTELFTGKNAHGITEHHALRLLVNGTDAAHRSCSLLKWFNGSASEMTHG